MAILPKEQKEQFVKETFQNISLIIPVYNEALVIPELLTRIESALKLIPELTEIIIVDDGSTDQTVETIKKLARKIPQLKIVSLTRNFGHQYAVSAGMDLVTSEVVGIIDADLQDPPELLPQMIERLKDGFDVVYAVRSSRKESLIKRILYVAFYRMLAWLADWSIPLDAGDFCVMRKSVVDHIKCLPERNRFLRGIRAWVGYRQTGFAYDRPARFADKSKYNMSKLLRLAFDGLFAFSLKPLRVVVTVGISFAYLSLSIAVVVIYRKLTWGLNPPGFATLSVITLFLGSIQLISLGLLGSILEEFIRK